MVRACGWWVCAASLKKTYEDSLADGNGSTAIDSKRRVVGGVALSSDAQRTAALKSLLSSVHFNQRLETLDISLSAANSVNFGRIIFQMLYQFHSYLSLLRAGEIELDLPGECGG